MFEELDGSMIPSQQMRNSMKNYKLKKETNINSRFENWNN